MKQQQISAATLCVFVMATPATIGLSLYTLTGNQEFRPLALESDGLGTVFSLREESTRVHVTLQWAAKSGTPADAHALGRAIKGSFDAKGYLAQISVVPVEVGERSLVTFRVGRNSVGPFSIADAVHAVPASIQAMRAFERAYPERFDSPG